MASSYGVAQSYLLVAKNIISFGSTAWILMNRDGEVRKAPGNAVINRLI